MNYNVIFDQNKKNTIRKRFVVSVI